MKEATNTQQGGKKILGAPSHVEADWITRIICKRRTHRKTWTGHYENVEEALAGTSGTSSIISLKA
jgi:hypothetical protein